MIDFAADILNITRENLEVLIGLFTRISAAVFLLPAFGEQAVPARIKLVASLCLTALFIAATPDTEIYDKVSIEFPMILVVESINGLIIGFSLRTLIFILQTCGAIAAQSASLAHSFGAGVGIDPQPAFSTLFVVGGLALLSLTGWHVNVVYFFRTTLSVLAFGSWPNAALISELGVDFVASSFRLGFSLATPFVAVSLIYNLGIGFVNKAMPQLMVAMVGAPAASFLGLTMLVVASPIILGFWKDEILSNLLSLSGLNNEH